MKNFFYRLMETFKDKGYILVKKDLLQRGEQYIDIDYSEKDFIAISYVTEQKREEPISITVDGVDFTNNRLGDGPGYIAIDINGFIAEIAWFQNGYIGRPTSAGPSDINTLEGRLTINYYNFNYYEPDPETELRDREKYKNMILKPALCLIDEFNLI